ncbi:hypothetical protein GCM10007905_03250 [Mixta theicola]|nr:hypothetical protein GCM10007905_03250 [Mixta theicola]
MRKQASGKRYGSGHGDKKPSLTVNLIPAVQSPFNAAHKKTRQSAGFLLSAHSVKQLSPQIGIGVQQLHELLGTT